MMNRWIGERVRAGLKEGRITGTMLRRRLDVNELLDIIITEALVAQKRSNFEQQVRHILLAAEAIEARIKDFWWVQHGSMIEQLMARKVEDDEE